MRDISRAFALSCRDILRPKILWISFLPCLLTALVWSVIVFLVWDPMTQSTKNLLSNSWISSLLNKATPLLGKGIGTDFSPYFTVIVLVVLMILTLLVVISFTAIFTVIHLLEGQKYYAGLRRAKGGSLLGSLWNTIISTSCALLLLILTFPLWWLPPLFSIIPPCIWGWLTAKLMSYDLLALHAEKAERVKICQEKRYSLLVIGILSGLMGVIPTFFWISSVFVFVLLPFLTLFMMWLYTLIFIFATLWFGHYLLFALRVDRQLRGESR